MAWLQYPLSYIYYHYIFYICIFSGMYGYMYQDKVLTGPVSVFLKELRFDIDFITKVNV